MGWDEMQAAGVVAVEWGERVAEILPEERLTLVLEHAGETMRRLRFQAEGATSMALLAGLPQGDLEPPARRKG